jgi:hypothetical protein
MKKIEPKLDPATIGISFVDILFALAVGQVLDPIKNWGENPKTNPVPLSVWTQLAVVLVLILTSWVGYHGSANRPRFHLAFFNWELFKFTLDVAMVVVYFIAAAVAARTIPTLRVEALLVMVSFALYAVWDLAGAWQKAGSNNPYKAEWDRVQKDAARPDVVEDWRPTNWTRIEITLTGLVIAVAFFVVTLLVEALHHPTRRAVVLADAVAILFLLAYRFAKDHLG